MRVTAFTRAALAHRRQKRDLTAQGYRRLSEIDWEINRGKDTDKVVTDIILGVDGNSLFYRVVNRTEIKPT